MSIAVEPIYCRYGSGECVRTSCAEVFFNISHKTFFCFVIKENPSKSKKKVSLQIFKLMLFEKT